MKYLITIMLVLSFSVFAQEQPPYLKDAMITVTLANGKTYKYSANEYAVVKRDSMGQSSVTPQLAGSKSDNIPVIASQPIVVEKKRNIISVGAVSSERGFNTSYTPSMVEFETRRKIGASIMYQNNFYEDFFLGGRVDTNRSGEINVGYGF